LLSGSNDVHIRPGVKLFPGRRAGRLGYSRFAFPRVSSAQEAKEVLETVIVYATRTGHSRALAEDLGKLTGSPVKQVIDLVGRSGTFGYLKTGFQAATKQATPIEDPGIDLGDVKTVVLVQPVWASGICPPLRSWLKAHRGELQGKRLALLSSQLGSPPEKIRINFEEEFGPLTAFATVVEQGGAEARSAKLREFADSLKE
jgi:hypothetical protein